MCHLCSNNISQDLELIEKNPKSMMAKSPKLIRVWERISAPQAVSESRLRKLSLILHLEISSGCESAGFNYRSLMPAEILVVSKEC